MGRKPIQIIVEGTRQVERELGRLKSRAVRNKIVRDALRKAYKPAKDAAKRLAPRESGLLRKSLGQKIKTYKDAGVAVVGPRRGFKRPVKIGKRKRGKTQKVQVRNPTHYAHLAGPRRKADFMQRAYTSSVSQVNSMLRAKILEGLEKEAQKARVKK